MPKSNYIVLKDGRVLAYSNKCASTAMLTHMRPHWSSRNIGQEWVAKNAETVILFVRHPLKRLISCFQDQVKGMTWEKFVDHVLAGAKDPHWNSQAAYHTFEGRFLPTEVYDFDDIDPMWEWLFGFKLKKEHASFPGEEEYCIGYRLDELLDFYREDLILWSKALDKPKKSML